MGTTSLIGLQTLSMNQSARLRRRELLAGGLQVGSWFVVQIVVAK